MKDLLSNLKELKTKDIIIALVIIALPFLFYTYKLLPNTQVWDTSFFTINVGEEWEEVSYYFWKMNVKLLIIFSLIIWYVTCSYWWKYVILVPLIIELFKLNSLIFNDQAVIDEFEYLQSLPLTIPVLLFVFLLSQKIGYFSKYKDIINEVNKEIEGLILELDINNDVAQIRKELEDLKRNRGKYDIEQYNSILLNLRKRLIKL